MVKRTGPTNYQLQKLIVDLEQNESKLWKRVARDLKKPSRQRRIVNVYKIDKFAREGEIVVVPGKVLNQGELSKKIEVAAFCFSDAAVAKIKKVGAVMSIQELFKKNPEGKGVRILG